MLPHNGGDKALASEEGVASNLEVVSFSVIDGDPQAALVRKEGEQELEASS